MPRISDHHLKTVVQDYAVHVHEVIRHGYLSIIALSRIIEGLPHLRSQVRLPLPRAHLYLREQKYQIAGAVLTLS